jgi:hypothetical protein
VAARDLGDARPGPLLFAFLQRNAECSAAFFGVPAGQVVEFGTELEI